MARYAGPARVRGRVGDGGARARRRLGGALGTVSGERLGAELRLLPREPQPAALAELDEHGLGRPLLPGFEVDTELVRRALALCPVDARPGWSRSAPRSATRARTSSRRGCASWLPGGRGRAAGRLR